MERAAFERLSVLERFNLLERSLKRATPVAVYGPAAQMKDNYRALMREFHPDRYTDTNEAAAASSLTALLNTQYELAEQQLAAGTYANTSTADEVEVDGVWYTRNPMVSSDIIESVSLTDSLGQNVVARLSTHINVNDLVDREAALLKQINETPYYDEYGYPYIPRYLSSFTAGQLRGSLLRYETDGGTPGHELISLRALGEVTNRQVDPKLVGWLWKRLLFALDHIHVQGILHGAVTPDAILIDPSPTDHGMMLADWSHATQHPHPIVTVVNDWKDLYPEEVWRKEAPLRSLDTYMAAQSMLWALGSRAPLPMKKYFEQMLKGSPATRLQQIDVLLNMWTKVLYDELHFEKRFVPVGYTAVTVQQAVDWSWWWK